MERRYSELIKLKTFNERLDYLQLDGKVLVHHLNPLTIDDILNRSKKIFDPENVVCVSFDTHEMITYGTNDIHKLLRREPVERRKNDTIPWR